MRQLHLRDALLERVIRTFDKSYFPRSEGHSRSHTPDLRNLKSVDPGSKHVTVHTLRHTAAMRFLQAGIDTSVIALWLGHESPATTSIYLHADQTLKQRALERTSQPEATLTQFQPDDPLLAWLEAL